MRTEHTLWRVSNGWLLVPEKNGTVLNVADATKCVVFKNLKDFADQYPKREWPRRTKKPNLTKKAHEATTTTTENSTNT